MKSNSGCPFCRNYRRCDQPDCPSCFEASLASATPSLTKRFLVFLRGPNNKTPCQLAKG